MNDNQRLLSEVQAMCVGAGERILEIYGDDGAAVELKDDRSPLTAADRAAHLLLVDALTALTPGIPVISEEGDPAERAAASRAPRFWLVDPLDGTKEFLKRTGEFTVNVALVEDGFPVLGVVHVPVQSVTYAGASGVGAFRETRGGRVSIRVRRADRDAMVVVASRDHAGPGVQRLLSRVPRAETRSMGSSLKFCLVASGEADIYLRDLPTMEWDTAAAQCVVEAAGGLVSDLSGSRLTYAKPELRNPALITVGDAELQWKELVE